RGERTAPERGAAEHRDRRPAAGRPARRRQRDAGGHSDRVAQRDRQAPRAVGVDPEQRDLVARAIDLVVEVPALAGHAERDRALLLRGELAEVEAVSGERRVAGVGYEKI